MTVSGYRVCLRLYWVRHRRVICNQISRESLVLTHGRHPIRDPTHGPQGPVSSGSGREWLGSVVPLCLYTDQFIYLETIRRTSPVVNRDVPNPLRLSVSSSSTPSPGVLHKSLRHFSHHTRVLSPNLHHCSTSPSGTGKTPSLRTFVTSPISITMFLWYVNNFFFF